MDRRHNDCDRGGIMRVEIGKRWRPGHRVYRDDESGAFSEVNSPLLASTEWMVQRALLSPLRLSGDERLRMAMRSAITRVTLATHS